MTLRLGALHDALLSAGANPTIAQQASEEVAGYESRLSSIDTKLTVLTWMVGTLTALVLGVFWLCFNILSRLK